MSGCRTGKWAIRIKGCSGLADRFVVRAIRLYEQGPGEADASARFGLYVRRWVRWTWAGMADTSKTSAIRTEPKADAARFESRRVLLHEAV